MKNIDFDNLTDDQLDRLVNDFKTINNNIMDGNLAMANQFENNGNSPICEVCESNVKEVYLCERCERSYCDKCSVPFTATNNIDFNCCKSCAGQDCYEDYE